LDIREKTLGLDHTIIAVTLRHLAESYRRSGQTTKAVSSLQRALTIDEHVIGNEAVVATNLQRLGTIRTPQRPWNNMPGFFVRQTGRTPLREQRLGSSAAAMP
jgi:hypothetical protein